jgi:hypothetical protein
MAMVAHLLLPLLLLLPCLSLLLEVRGNAVVHVECHNDPKKKEEKI